MKEILIHKNSHLFASEQAENFVYVAKSAEIVLFGSQGIYFNHGKVAAKEDDLYILEENGIYHFQMPQNASVLVTVLPFTKKQAVYQFYHSLFQHEEIKALCIVIAEQLQQRAEKNELLLHAYLNKLGFLVLNHFTYQGENRDNKESVVNEERFRVIHEIMLAHSRDTFSLNDLANELHLTPQYVSQFFKRNFGCTFLHYLALIRLKSAMNEIQNTTKSFLTIAMDSGFANIRSFQATFEQAFNCSPKQYRQLLHQRSTPEQYQRSDAFFKAFMEKEIKSLPISYRTEKEENYQVTLMANGQGKVLRHTWQNLMTVGRARLLVLDDIRKQLMTIQQDIGFKMIRFHGIFNDDMHVYEEDEQGNPIYTFHQVNDALDFIIKIGLKPFVEIGFMPSQLALYPDMKILSQVFLVSPPKDMKKWQNLVIAFLKNCINRYGFDEVVTWYFEFWNNGGISYNEKDPNDLRSSKFWQGTLDEYLEFYQATYLALKSVDPQLKIGGPAIGINVLDYFGDNLEKYLRFLRKNNCLLDFVSFHIYPNQIIYPSGEYTVELPVFKERLNYLKKYLKDHHIKKELHITEWSTWGLKEPDGFNDECGKALYLLKSIVDSMDQMDSLGYWTFSDYTETMKTKNQEIFSNNIGLFTSNGIKKAAYHAYSLLRKLGDEELGKGEYYIFTRRKQNYQLLLFFDQKFDESEASHACFQMSLMNLPNGTYEKKVYFLNSQSGSSYDVWKAMGSYQELMEEDVQYLKAHSMMSYVRETLRIKQNQDHETRIVNAGEAILIEWIYKY